jgi:hypothetical protein
MIATIAGFALGVFAFIELLSLGWARRPAATSPRVDLLIDWAFAVIAVLGALAIYEGFRLWRSHPEGMRLRELVLARQYRLSTSALLIGLTGASIYLLFGSAGYTSTFEVVIEGALGTRDWPAAGRWILLVAVLIGMLASTVQRGSFKLDLRPRLVWFRNFIGGAFMGFGVALAPGGNDVLVLYSLPILSPHAIPALAAMAVGIVAGLLLMRTFFGIEMRVSCRSDLYVSG